jgi:hypothetical protein
MHVWTRRPMGRKGSHGARCETIRIFPVPGQISQGRTATPSTVRDKERDSFAVNDGFTHLDGRGLHVVYYCIGMRGCGNLDKRVWEVAEAKRRTANGP